MGLDFGAVGAISGLSAQKFAQAMALQQNAQSSPEALARTALYGHQGGLFDSEAGLNTVRAGLLPQQTDADIAEAKSRAGLNNANAAEIPGLDKSMIARNYGEATNLKANAGLAGANTGAINQSTQALGPAGLSDNPLVQEAYRRLHNSLAYGYPLSNSGAYGYGPQPVPQP